MFNNKVMICGVDTSTLPLLKENQKTELINEAKRGINLNDTKEKLGYVPEKDNVVFSRLMDAGKMLTGRINDIKDKHGFMQVAIGIYLVDF